MFRRSERLIFLNDKTIQEASDIHPMYHMAQKRLYKQD